MINAEILKEAFSELKEFRHIDRPTTMKLIEEVFRTVIRKTYGSDENFDIIVNDSRGEIEIYRRRVIMDPDDVENESLQIGLKEARKIDPDYEIGDEAIEEVPIDSEFTRRAILVFKQTMTSRFSELEKNNLYKKYAERVGDVVNAEVYQVWSRETLLIDEDGNELILPREEKIPADFFKKGDTVRAVIKKVDMRNGSPMIILSRRDNMFLGKLLEMEVPEIFEGLIVIKKIVREPGERAKVAVESYDDRIDPVGACVGMKGSRIHGIVRELRNENIDVINFTNNKQLLIQRALSPAKLTSVDLNEETRKVKVFLKPDQVSLAIGKGGLNIKLASRLVGYDIEVYRDTEEEEYDIDLDEFSDEIESWIIDELKGIGCDTAKSVLELNAEEVVRRTDLEEETVKEVFRILKSEFENEK